MNNLLKGLNVENEIINHINTNKYIHNMNANIRSFLKEIFNDQLSNTRIVAKKYCENYKPDIIIQAGDKKYM